jgi:hypothetical protein
MSVIKPIERSEMGERSEIAGGCVPSRARWDEGGNELL